MVVGDTLEAGSAFLLAQPVWAQAMTTTVVQIKASDDGDDVVAQVARRLRARRTDAGGDDRVLIVPAGEAVLVLEMNGYQTSLPRVVAPLSELGAVHSAFWNVNMHTAFTFAAEGRVVTALDAVDIEQRSGLDPDALRGEVAELDHWGGDVDRRAWLLALLELRTGVRATAPLLGPAEAYVLPPPQPVDTWPLRLADPELAEAFLRDGPGMLGAYVRLVMAALGTQDTNLEELALALERMPLGEEWRPVDSGLAQRCLDVSEPLLVPSRGEMATWAIRRLVLHDLPRTTTNRHPQAEQMALMQRRRFAPPHRSTVFVDAANVFPHEWVGCGSLCCRTVQRFRIPEINLPRALAAAGLIERRSSGPG